MKIVITKEKSSIIGYINNKKVNINKNFCFLLGNIYNLDKLGKFSEDTKTEDKILKLYDRYKEDLFTVLNGEYAVILVVDKKIILARDRIGSKQIYYSIINNTFICSDTLEYFIKNYKSQLEIDKQILANYLCYCYIQEPNTIFKNIYKLNAASYLTYNENEISIKKYYDLVKEYKKNNGEFKKLNKTQKKLENSLENAIKLRINDKNKIGIYFSAGIDSTLIAAIAKNEPNKEINTYTIGFHEEERNEAVKAKEIAKYLKTNHHEFYLEHDEAKKIIKQVPKIYSEPFADPSIIPTIFLYNKTDKDMDIILTGDGADQFFCGSDVYDYFKFKMYIKRGIKNIVKALKYKSTYRLFGNVYISKKYVTNTFINIKPKTYYNLPFIRVKRQEKYMLFDIKTFLANRLLTKMSFPASYNNINISHPFIDNNVVNTTLKIDQKCKYYNNNKKYVLKKILYKKIPVDLLNNKKNGFGIPLKKWLCDLYCDDIVKYSNPEILEKQGLFPVDKINKKIERLKNKKIGNDECYVMFSYYIFQLWYQEYIEDLWN